MFHSTIISGSVYSLSLLPVISRGAVQHDLEVFSFSLSPSLSQESVSFPPNNNAPKMEYWTRMNLSQVQVT